MGILTRKHTRIFRHNLLYAFAKIGYISAGILPRTTGLFLFGSLGKLLYYFSIIEKRRTLEHLRLIYGNEWSEKKIKATACDVFQQLGKNLFDSIYLSKLDYKKLNTIVSCDSMDELLNEYNKGKGIVTVTAHTGCFEMLLHYFPAHGFKCFAIGRKMFDPRLEDIVRQTRAGKDIVYLNRSEGTRKMIRLLNEGRFFGVLVDQDTNVEGVYADFLGRKAYTPSGPVKLAMKFNKPLFVITTARLPGNKHHIYISHQIPLKKTDNFESDIIDNVTTVNDTICKTIRKHPSQWVWMHRRWQHQPYSNNNRSINGV